MGDRGRWTSFRIYEYICISHVSVACMNVEEGGEGITLKEANTLLVLVWTSRKDSKLGNI